MSEATENNSYFVPGFAVKVADGIFILTVAKNPFIPVDD
jgi:hypothetical protein